MQKHLLKLVVLSLMLLFISLTAYSAVKNKQLLYSSNMEKTISTQGKISVSKEAYISESVYKSTYASVYQNAYKANPVIKVLLPQKRGIAYIGGDKASKLLALTFDDGPDLVNTPKVLDVLKAFDVQATFFVIGKQVEKFPDVAKRIVQEGHEIGNHTYSHANLSKQSAATIRKEILQAEKAIDNITKVKTTLFRPPFGVGNPVMLSSINDLGYETVMWNVDTGDWKALPATKLIEHQMKYAQNGAIILLHSGEGQKLDGTVKSLAFIIPALQEKGYKFVTVSEILGISSNN